MISVAGHQPNLYPYCGYFAKAASVDKFVIVDNTQYVKKEYHNRNRVLLLDGEVQWLSIPVKNAGHYKQPINSMEIDNTKDWRRVHGKTLFCNYKKSKYFEWFYPEIEKMLSREWTMLADYNISFIRRCFDILDIKVPVSLASVENMTGHSSELILDICRKSGADAYLHGKHAMDYVDFSMLEEAGIKNLIQEYNPVTYEQTCNEFIPNLSVLDILFNCGPESKQLIMSGNKLSAVNGN